MIVYIYGRNMRQVENSSGQMELREQVAEYSSMARPFSLLVYVHER